MTLKEFKNLKVGDIVRYTGKGSDKNKIGEVDIITPQLGTVWVRSTGRCLFDHSDLDDIENCCPVTYKDIHYRNLQKVEF